MLALAAVVGGYILSSYFFLKHPTLLHKKKKLAFRAVHISHRGGAGEHLENTITAFKHAHSQGTDMFEIDLHITKDGQVVISHDNDLERATGQPISIADTNYADLPPLYKSLKLDFNHRHVTVSTSTDRRIPLLRELFELFPDTPVNVDIKIDRDDLIKEVSALAREYKREHLVVWGSRSDSVTRKCHAENPFIPLLFSLRRVVQLLALYYTGLLSFVPLKESAFEIFMPSMFLRTNIFQSAPSRRTRIYLHIADFLLMSKGLFQHLDERGIQTYLWVLNEEEDFERAYSYGAAGVMTDFPIKLRKYLTEHPEYELRNRKGEL